MFKPKSSVTVQTKTALLHPNHSETYVHLQKRRVVSLTAHTHARTHGALCCWRQWFVFLFSRKMTIHRKNVFATSSFFPLVPSRFSLLVYERPAAESDWKLLKELLNKTKKTKQQLCGRLARWTIQFSDLTADWSSCRARLANKWWPTSLNITITALWRNVWEQATATQGASDGWGWADEDMATTSWT